MVYFIRRGHRGPIKIGYSFDPERRCRVLQRKHSEFLSIDAVIHGELQVERELHKRFEAGALGGEWFDYDTPGLFEFVSGAAHFEGFWPDDRESPCILDILEVMEAAGFECPERPVYEYDDEITAREAKLSIPARFKAALLDSEEASA